MIDTPPIGDQPDPAVAPPPPSPGPLALSRLLAGLPTDGLDPDSLPEPWRELARIVLDAPPGLPRVALLKTALAERPDAAEIRAAVSATLRAGVSPGPSAPGADWEPPLPFDDHQLPPFPADALPPWLRDFVLAEADATQTPPDLAGMLALAVLSTACAGRFAVRPWGDWTEPVNLYAMVVLPPGHRKSAVLASVAAPVHEFEADAAERLAPTIARAESERTIAEHALRRAEDAVARATAGSAAPAERAALVAHAERLADLLAALAVPPRPRLIVDDCSPERLATLLHEQDQRIAVLSPEGGIFDLMAGRYSTTGAPNFEHFLKGHAGDPIVVDRVGRPSELIRRPAITIGLAVQPDVLRGLMARPGFRGRGLLARFLYALPASPLGRRAIKPPPVPEPVRAAYHAHVRALLGAGVGCRVTGVRDGAHASPDTRHPTPITLVLSDPAADRLAAFAARVELRLAEFGDLAPLSDWGGKLVGAVARLAALLHLATHADAATPPPISDNTVAAAVALGEYAAAHATAAYAAMGADPAVDDARYLLAVIATLAKPALPKQQLWQAARGRIRDARTFDRAIALLLEHRYLRERHAPPRTTPTGGGVPGRKPAPTYLVNPLAFPTPRPQPAEAAEL